MKPVSKLIKHHVFSGGKYDKPYGILISNSRLYRLLRIRGLPADMGGGALTAFPSLHYALIEQCP